MNYSRSFIIALFSGLLWMFFFYFMTMSVHAQEKSPRDSIYFSTMSDNPNDPENLLMTIDQRRSQKNALFEIEGLLKINESIDKGKNDLYNSTHLKLGFALTHVFQWLSEAPLNDITWATASTMDFLGTWEIVDRGGPKQGQLYFLIQGRWGYGTIGPELLGTHGVGSMVGTANTFSEYVPALLLRNFYWQQGSKEAGWTYRIGKISADATLSTSAHIASPLTFLTTGGTGPFANALTDSGLGIAAVWYINDRLKLLGLVSDANANRYNWGDITAGDFYSALEFSAKIAPKTDKAGYSKVTLWHTDATKDGEAVNGHLGPEGWGFFLKHEQELSTDGDLIMVLRYGKSFNGSAVYEQQANASFLLYNPTGITRLQNDLVGINFTWLQSNVEGARGESNIEIFYRFPFLSQLDASVNYQAIINPALDHSNNFASAFALRLRMNL